MALAREGLGGARFWMISSARIRVRWTRWPVRYSRPSGVGPKRTALADRLAKQKEGHLL